MNPPPPPVRIVPIHSRDHAAEDKYELFCHGHRVSVVVTSEPGAVREWISFTRRLRATQIEQGRLVVGLGVQQTRRSGPATIQLCMGPHCLIFQLLRHAKSPVDHLTQFFQDPTITFVGLGTFGDVVDRLPDSYRVHCHVDLSRLPNSGLEESLNNLAVVSTMEGFEGPIMEESGGRGDWDRHRLTLLQVLYASLDAFLAHLIGNNLQAWNINHP